MTDHMNEIRDLPVLYKDLKWYERRQVRQWYVEEQGGSCYFCKENLSDDPPEWVTRRQISWKLFPEGFLDHPVHLHHDHDTGLTIGAVHAYCNAILFQYYGE